MLTHMMLAMFLAAAPQQVDTLVTVPHGTRLELNSRRGDVRIRTWDRSAVRISTDDERSDLRIERTGSVLQVRPRDWNSHSIDLELTVPRDMPIRVNGMDTEADIRGAGAEVDVQTLNGDIRVEGGTGYVKLRTVHGDIELSDARGRVTVGTVSNDITLHNVEGDVQAESVNGDVTMTAMRSGNVSVEAVTGDLEYEGTVRANGHYSLSTHSGDVVMGVPRDANATIRVSTYQGDFQADYPVRMIGSTEDREFTFTLGNGSASIALSSFSGSVRVRRPGS
ncbi:MAG: DUF4097 family beta strand repeat-containing protein [Gemmatimonadota bacterium]|jgi:DUF4097 and DUF4098 domain-containing protein YvlB